jgi:molybdopterin converting factor small subunit
MKVEIKLFGYMKEYVPGGEDYSSRQVALQEGARVDQLLEKLGIPIDIPKIVLIDGVTVKPNHPLKEGDSVNIFPPLTGG